MIELKGKNNTAKIFTDTAEAGAIGQVINLCNQEFVAGSQIRVMPDCHAGAGCTIGFTMTITDKVCPNLVGVDIGCTDKDTEYLTPKGWRKISEYDGEKIAVYNKDLDQTVFAKPIAYIRKEGDKFFHLKTKYGVDQMLSEEHTCLVEKGSHHREVSRGKKYTITAKDLYDKHTASKLGFRDNFICEIPHLQTESFSELTEAQIRVQVMVMADGSINKNKCYCHFKKSRKIDRCLSLLRKANIEFQVKDRANGTCEISFVPPVKEKRISYFYNASIGQLGVICDEVMHWDYAVDQNAYCSVYKEDVDFVQYAFATKGFRTSISHDKREGKESYRCLVSLKPRVQIAGTPKTDIEIVDSEDGYKYCFTTHTGFWIMRRNGCICVTGNCGMRTIKLDRKEIDYAKLDQVIRENVPSGMKAHNGRIAKFPRMKELKCFRELRNTAYLERSLGTLGGGNHFIEVDVSENEDKYLIIHSGSRNLGYQVAKIYQKFAIEQCSGKDEMYGRKEQIIARYKEAGRKKEIAGALKRLQKEYAHLRPSILEDLCYLTGQFKDDYLHDMQICQEFARMNRGMIARIIIEEMGFGEVNSFETVHNYINFDDNILRKGAVSANDGEKLLIPINMRDGSILGIGKGNADWNNSAPHGAGRVMSRRKAKELLDVDEFKESMKGVYTTSVGLNTLDEAPMAYKGIDDIIDNIGENVAIIEVLKPEYNFKASE